PTRVARTVSSYTPLFRSGDAPVPAAQGPPSQRGAGPSGRCASGDHRAAVGVVVDVHQACAVGGGAGDGGGVDPSAVTGAGCGERDRKSTRLKASHVAGAY